MGTDTLYLLHCFVTGINDNTFNLSKTWTQESDYYFLQQMTGINLTVLKRVVLVDESRERKLARGIQLIAAD